MEPNAQTPVTPTAPVEAPAPAPAPVVEPAAPVVTAPEPVAPAPAPIEAPAAPVVAPVAPVEAPAAPVYKTLEEYTAELYGEPQAPAEFTMPSTDSIDTDDPAAVQKFFADYAANIRSAAIEEAMVKFRAETRATSIENQNWQIAFKKYSDLTTNQQLRDSVQAIREFNFQRGIAMTPEQAADILYSPRGSEYQRGIADSAVTTTIQEVQPVNGGSVQVIPDNGASAKLAGSFGTSTEEADLADFLDSKIKAGSL